MVILWIKTLKLRFGFLFIPQFHNNFNTHYDNYYCPGQYNTKATATNEADQQKTTFAGESGSPVLHELSA